MEMKSVTKKGDFWGGLECISTGAALMADWEWGFGTALGLVRGFLKPTEKRSGSFPCPARPACECRHEVRETGFGLVAVCMCGGGECDSFVIEPKDILVYGLDRKAFGRSLRGAFGFGEVGAAAYSTPWMEEIGVGPVRAPVFFSSARRETLLREMEKLLAVREGPLILLTPTGAACSQEVDSALRRAGGAHVSLSAFVDVEVEGFKLRARNDGMWADFERRAATLRNDGGTLRSIHREIAAVRGEFVELRSAKQRLEKMLADGLFAFTRKVDAASFKTLCTILAEGDVAKASRSLAAPEATIRATVRRWCGKGKEYRAMVELVRWRKKVGRKERLPLNDAIVHERAETADYPGLLSDVLDGLLSMTEENWADRCEELAELLRPVVSV